MGRPLWRLPSRAPFSFSVLQAAAETRPSRRVNISSEVTHVSAVRGRPPPTPPLLDTSVEKDVWAQRCFRGPTAPLHYTIRRSVGCLLQGRSIPFPFAPPEDPVPAVGLHRLPLCVGECWLPAERGVLGVVGVVRISEWLYAVMVVRVLHCGQRLGWSAASPPKSPLGVADRRSDCFALR